MIARELGISRTQAHDDVARYARELGKESATERRTILTRQLEGALMDENVALAVLRKQAREDAERGERPDVEISRAIAAHNRTVRAIVSELAALHGCRKPGVSRVEHTGEAGGPILVASLDDVDAALAVAAENAAGVEAARKLN